MNKMKRESLVFFFDPWKVKKFFLGITLNGKKDGGGAKSVVVRAFDFCLDFKKKGVERARVCRAGSGLVVAKNRNEKFFFAFSLSLWSKTPSLISLSLSLRHFLDKSLRGFAQKVCDGCG